MRRVGAVLLLKPILSLALTMHHIASRRVVRAAARAAGPRKAAREPCVVEDVEGLCGAYDTILLDQFGVVHDGKVPYDGAPELVRRLQRAGKRVVVLSNSSKRRRDTPPTKQVASRPARIVKLLVGGREHATTRSTLSLVTGSFLDRLVNQEDEGGMAAMDDGRFFIDRDGDIFGLVLDYLRSAGESVPQFDPETLRRLRIDADARRRVFLVRARAPSVPLLL